MALSYTQKGWDWEDLAQTTTLLSIANTHLGFMTMFDSKLESCLGTKGIVSTNEFGYTTSKTKPVDGMTIRHAFAFGISSEHFRCPVSARTCGAMQGGCNLCRQAQIGNLDTSIIRQQTIFRFQITIHVLLVMEGLQTEHDAGCKVLTFAFGKTPLLMQMVAQVTTRH